MFGKEKTRELLPQELGFHPIRMFRKVDDNKPITFGFDFPDGPWEVGITCFNDREAAETYFQNLYDEEDAKGNASPIKDFGEWQGTMIEEVENSGDSKFQKIVKKNKGNQIGRTASAGIIKI